MVHQGNEGYLPEAAINMLHIQDQPQFPIFETNETSNAMETNLVLSHSESQVQGNRELQDVMNNHRKISTRLPKKEMGTNLQTPQVCITCVSSRGRNYKMSAAMQQSANQQNFFGHSYYMSASSPLAEYLSPSECDYGERHEIDAQSNSLSC